MTTDTDSSDDEESEVDIGSDTMDRLTKAVKIYTDCLLDLSPALECPAPDTKRVDFVAALQQQAPLISTGQSDSPSPVLEAQASEDDERASSSKVRKVRSHLSRDRCVASDTPFLAILTIFCRGFAER